MSVKKSFPPSRAMALDAIRLVLGERQAQSVDAVAGQISGKPFFMDAQPALDQVLTVRNPSPADAGLATELAYGYLRRKARLEAIVTSFLRSAAKTPPGLLRILCLAAYELLHLDRVPAYATLDWAVSRTAKRYGAAMGKVANGVLRNLDRASPETFSKKWFLSHFDSEEAAWGACYSAPQWLVRLWKNAYGDRLAEAYLAASLEAPPVGLRVNRLHKGAQELCGQLASSSILRNGFSFGFASGSIDRSMIHELVASGRASRQSYASQQVLAELEPESWPAPIFDACAGRGGKTTHLLERGLHVVAASDVHIRRLAGLFGEFSRLALADFAVRPAVFISSATLASPLRNPPGTILLDAPCSGLGVLSRRPEAKWRRTPTDFENLCTLQRSMLCSAYDSVAPGGLVVYITCTLNPAENNEAILHLLNERFGARLEIEYRTPFPERTNLSSGEFFYGALVRKPQA